MIEIVRADERHISDIGKLWLEFIRFHQDIDPIFASADNAVSGFEEELVRRLIKTGYGLVLVALDKGQVVGYALSEIKEPPKGSKREKYGYISHMAVTASYRRRGVGKKIFDEIMKWFYSKNIDRVEVEITTKNQVASSFWEKHGFTDYMRKLYRQI
jgi:ribosomal protein S18 acetylase RimI-like enzyme